MNKLSMCRICMIKNVRMHDIINTNLQEIYEKLTAVPFVINDSRPLQVCYICHARLQNCCQLRECCLKSEQLFTRVLETNELQLLQNVNTIEKTERMVIWCSRKDHRGFDNDMNEQTDGITHVQVKIEQIDDNDQILDPPIHSEDNLDVDNMNVDERIQEEGNSPLVTSDMNAVSQSIEAVNSSSISEFRIEANKSTPTSEHRIEANKSTSACELRIEANKSTPTSELRTEADNSTSTSDNSIANNSEETRQTTAPIADVSLGVDETPRDPSDETRRNCLTTNLRHNVRSETVKVVLHRMDIDKSNGSYEDFHSPLMEHNYSNVTRDGLNSQSASFVENVNPVEVEDNPRFINSSRLRQKKFVLHKTVAKKSQIKHEVTTDKTINKSSKKRLKKHKDDLLKKIGVHSTDKPFQCPTCAKCCRRKDAFIIHLRIHTGERPYKCSLCSKSFSRKDVLTSHIRTHTGEKPYKCDVCGKRFVQKCDLVRHIQIHSGEKPYMCNICEKCFNKKGNLTKHVRIHTGENPYKCDKCGKRFAQKSTLTRHIRIHTPTSVK